MVQGIPEITCTSWKSGLVVRGNTYIKTVMCASQQDFLKIQTVCESCVLAGGNLVRGNGCRGVSEKITWRN